jgi:hypothetical protein
MTRSPVLGNGAVRPLGRGGLVALAGLLVVGTWLATADPFTFAFFLAYGLVGGLLIARRPANVIGWITLAIAFGFIGTTVPTNLGVAALAAGTAPTREFVLVWIGSWAGSASYGLFLALAILFPSGQLPHGRWRGPAATAIAAAAMLTALTAIAPTVNYILPGGVANAAIPNRLAVLPSLPIWSLVPTDGSLILLIVALLGVAVGALAVRYRRTTGVARLQLRWLVSALVFCIAALAFGLGALALFGDKAGGLGWLPAIVAFPTVPLAIGIAITRHRLFEIDRIISRTVSYAILTGILAAVFAAVILGLQAVIAPVTGGQTIPIAVSTLVVAALFQPLRHRVQAIVDRQFDRARIDSELVVAALSERLRDEVELSNVRHEVLLTIGQALHPASAGVWLRGRPQ